jgi:hypothetical protein
MRVHQMKDKLIPSIQKDRELSNRVYYVQICSLVINLCAGLIFAAATMLVLANADDMTDMIKDLVAFEVILLADERVFESIK